jgi:hypothetical protein
MSVAATNIKTLINEYIRGDGVKAFQNNNLNRILLLLADLADGSGGTGGDTGTLPGMRVTSATFINTIDCPIPSLNGATIAVFFNEAGRFLEKDAPGGAEWSDLPSGGFRVLLPGFDKTQQNYHFYVFEVIDL